MKCPGTPQKLQTLLPDAFVPVEAAPELFGLLPTCWFCRTVLNISERPVIAVAKASSFTLVESDAGDVTGFVNAADPVLWGGAIVTE
jgi:hypothetical protein